MTIQLRDAINNASDLLQLNQIAEQLEPQLSYLGRSYMIAKSSQSIYAGEAPVGALVDRALEIIKNSGYTRSIGSYPVEWTSHARSFDKQIDRIYYADSDNFNTCGIVTIIARMTRVAFVCITSSSHEDMGHQYKWEGLGEDAKFERGLERHILILPGPGSYGRRWPEPKPWSLPEFFRNLKTDLTCAPTGTDSDTKLRVTLLQRIAGVALATLTVAGFAFVVTAAIIGTPVVSVGITVIALALGIIFSYDLMVPAHYEATKLRSGGPVELADPVPPAIIRIGRRLPVLKDPNSVTASTEDSGKFGFIFGSQW